MEAKYEIYIPHPAEWKVWYYDHSRNAFGHIKDEDNAVQIAEDESLGLIVFYATVDEIQKAVDLPEPDVDYNKVTFTAESGWTRLSQTVYNYSSYEMQKREPLPSNYAELCGSRVYCMYSADWISDTNEYIAQRDAESREESIYFFYDDDLVPEKYSGLRELMQETVYMVDGYDMELPTDLEIDQQTMVIVDWFEKNANDISRN